MAGEEQGNPNNHPAPERQKQRQQWLLFGILAAVLVSTVLIVALLRPLIFGRIVPAVMGDFNTPIPVETDESIPSEAQEIEEPTPATDNEEESQNEVFIPAASSGDGTEATAPNDGESSEPEAAPVPSEPTQTLVTYTIQSGDTLTKIAGQHGISVEDLITANNLTNADYISVGQILIIPQPQ